MMNIHIALISSLLLHVCNDGKQNQIDIHSSHLFATNEMAVNTLTAFEEFASHFEYRETPYEINTSSNDWISFYGDRAKEIDRKDAIEFLCNGDEKAVLQPKGGYYNFYYGYKIKLNGYIGLIYYRSSNQYNGYILSFFSQDGNFKSTILLSGVIGEFDPEAQKEAKIYGDGNIEITDLTLIDDIDYSGNTFKSNYSIKKYNLTSEGNLIELSNVSKLNIDVKCDSKQKDRIVLIN